MNHASSPESGKAPLSDPGEASYAVIRTIGYVIHRINHLNRG